MEEKTIVDEKGERKEYLHYISSLAADIESVKRTVRGHWRIESMLNEEEAVCDQPESDKVSGRSIIFLRKVIRQGKKGWNYSCVCCGKLLQ